VASWLGGGHADPDPMDDGAAGSGGQGGDLADALADQGGHDDLGQVADDDDDDLFGGLEDDGADGQADDEDPVKFRFARGSVRWRGGEAVVFTELVE
jgi:hypothetical protein